MSVLGDLVSPGPSISTLGAWDFWLPQLMRIPTAHAAATTAPITPGVDCNLAVPDPPLRVLHWVVSRAEQASELRLEQMDVADGPRLCAEPPTVTPPPPGTWIVTPKAPCPRPPRFAVQMSKFSEHAVTAEAQAALLSKLVAA